MTFDRRFAVEELISQTLRETERATFAAKGRVFESVNSKSGRLLT
jgi:hypothetical protein